MSLKHNNQQMKVCSSPHWYPMRKPYCGTSERNVPFRQRTIVHLYRVVVCTISLHLFFLCLKMKKLLLSLGTILLVASHLSNGVGATEEKAAKKKLQIGVKKRVENCEQKSRRGDLLSMHYTVRVNTVIAMNFWTLNLSAWKGTLWVARHFFLVREAPLKAY